MTKLFLITGASSGLGRAFAEAALQAGHTVVGTVRKQADAAEFEQLQPGKSLARILDVTDDDAVFQTVDEIEAEVGPIDVVIANAGYGHEGVFEESTMAELRAQFEVNVFGVVATVKAVLPYLRRRRRGHILGVTSMAGLITVPGTSFYQGSKYAVEGILETVGKEVAPFGVHVTAIAPGSFRTDWAGRSMVRTVRSVPDYDQVMNPVREHRLAASGKQLGNPRKAAEAVLHVLDVPNPPAHLVLGSDALRLIANGRAAVDKEISEWAELSRSTDFPDGAQLPG
ncbi:oxidoreductase [Amycolatopsis rubida]|uniref:Oxidoreductase n=1 Tax=Amycolatopsis rubida TaxID=112413 RepID=A0ABX0BP56_9PSEU|nr:MULTISPECIES: oxidoreductase [Amycolatopsis]MYW91210.1 SDR family NAD(P)-dependent oxidoreductase [Amycolatopsis rubida]NEC56195.1 oxidoreductase [Amycolatopsis rubida]OAP21062.1 3-oxoacyl-[acyl-carrier-protein] reductase FabG [Amycolatopsis sp. M39]